MRADSIIRVTETVLSVNLGVIFGMYQQILNKRIIYGTTGVRRMMVNREKKEQH